MPPKVGLVSEPPNFSSRLRSTQNDIAHVLTLYPLSTVALSFNGGKDCLVLFHLLRELLGENFRSIHCFYFENEGTLPETTHFVQECADKYGVKVDFLAEDFRTGLSRVKNQFNLRAVFLGTRRTDPHGDSLSLISPTTAGWPQLDRICPLLDWEYEDVWYYLLSRNFAYCSLYDNGYTSLGSADNTRPNPALLQPDGSYAPAHQLKNSLDERLGRT